MAGALRRDAGATATEEWTWRALAPGVQQAPSGAWAGVLHFQEFPELALNIAITKT